MGPASGSAKSAPHKQRKGLHPTGFEETLAWDDGLNWFHFRKVGQRYFFLLPEFLYGIAEREGDPPEMRQQAGKNQTRPCAVICGRSGDWVGERHHRSSKPALLEACEPVVASSCHRQLPREALGYEVSVFSAEKHRVSLRENSNEP